MPMRRISTSLPTVGFADEPSPLSEGLANAAATFGQLWPRLAQIEADKASREEARAERRADRQEAREDRQKLWTDRAGERETDRADRQMHDDALAHERDQDRQQRTTDREEDRKIRVKTQEDAEANRALDNAYKYGIAPPQVMESTPERHGLWTAQKAGQDARAVTTHRADGSQELAREKFARDQAIQEIGDPDHDLVEQAIVDATGTKRLSSYRRPLDAKTRATRAQAINRRVDELMGRAKPVEVDDQEPVLAAPPAAAPAPRQPAGTGYQDPQVGLLWNKGIPNDRDWNASQQEPAPQVPQGPALWTAPGAITGQQATAQTPTPANVQPTGGTGQEQARQQFMAGAGGWGMLAPPNLIGGAAPKPAPTNALTSLTPDAQAILTGPNQQARDTAIASIKDPAQRLAIIQALKAAGHR